VPPPRPLVPLSPCAAPPLHFPFPSCSGNGRLAHILTRAIARPQPQLASSGPELIVLLDSGQTWTAYAHRSDAAHCPQQRVECAPQARAVVALSRGIETLFIWRCGSPEKKNHYIRKWMYAYLYLCIYVCMHARASDMDPGFTRVATCPRLRIRSAFF